ncbi:hypothetical protein [Micropruina glycogenica]|uniref:hypothetical protein n=1 Tax=Micropruina glycogenica TaxID=75385 RepID=UPI000CF6C74B
MSMDAHHRLVNDGLLSPGDVVNDWDLAELADVVWNKFGSQKELTDRLPRHDWRMAEPNRGHHEAAALLAEGAVRSVLTINYDLAQEHALVDVNGRSTMTTVVRGPEDTDSLSGRTLVYLHRSCDADSKDWILRASIIADTAIQVWESAIADSILMSPVVVFVGLGSPAPILAETVSRLVTRTGISCYLVDPTEPDPTDSTTFYASLNGSATHIGMTWCDFASELADRLRDDVVGRLLDASCTRLSELGGHSNAWPALRTAMLKVPLHQLGRKRASWLLRRQTYCLETEVDTALLGDLFAAVAAVAEAVHATSIALDGRGNVRLGMVSGNTVPMRIANVAGQSTWNTVATELSRELDAWPAPDYRLVLFSNPDPTPDLAPIDLVRSGDPVDLIRGADQIVALGTAEAVSLATADAAALARRICA